MLARVRVKIPGLPEAVSQAPCKALGNDSCDMPSIPNTFICSCM